MLAQDSPNRYKCTEVIANVVEQVWLTSYPWYDQVTYDCGTEFMAKFTTMIAKDYNFKEKYITVHNLQANAIVEHVHQIIGNMLCTFK